MVVLVTGASGQLGQALQFIEPDHPELAFYFAGSDEGDITDKAKLNKLFADKNPSYCINAAAYTAVDKAETEPEKAHLTNAVGARNVAEICREFQCTLIHISTDFVFDGSKQEPYTEEDIPNPQSIYGQTKLDGERAIQSTISNYFIIRTSWVYSQFGTNFMKTMLRLASERDSISVVDDQIGTPTNAVDLAEALLQIIEAHALNPEPSTVNRFGIYNFSNEGQCSWYDFAKKIFEVNKIEIDLRPIPSSAFPTAATRPKYSVLNKGKLSKFLSIRISHWDDRIKITPNEESGN
ncbi:MAG TPA: dTDP-4-dehydrorhamnose reductase [Flavobacterium sp.]|jgi:dTDP-4-dehydrorhamnose reductase